MDLMLEVGLSNAVAAGILALAALLVSTLCRRRPALVHGLWLLVLLKLLTPPLLRIPLDWPESSPIVADPGEPVSEELPAQTEPPAFVILLEAAPAAQPQADSPQMGEAGAAPAEVPPEVQASSPAAPWPWQQVLGGVWLAGSCAWLLLASWRLWHFRRLLGHAVPAPAALQGRADQLARRLGLGRAPKVWMMPGRVAPLLWWFGGRPRLLLPAGLPGQISSEGLDTVLLHELAHLRRRDHWVRLLELLAMGLYWWHPVVWYARRELREAEEQCCDAWVVTTLPEAGRLYANTLLDTLDFLSHEGPAVPLLASGLGPVTDLKRRLTMILSGRTPRGLGWPSCLTLFAVAVLCLPCLPAWGQDRFGPVEAPKPEAPPPATVDAGRVQDLEAKVRERQRQVKDLQKQLQALQRQLEAQRDLEEAAKLEGEAKPVERPKPADDPKARETKKARPHYVLIINLEGMEPGQVKKIVDRLQEVLPATSRVEVAQRYPEPRTDKGRPVTARPASPNYPPGAPSVVHPPTVEVPYPVPPGGAGPRYEKVPPGPLPVPPPQGGTDARIDRLERQMEKILHRLDELQRDRDGKTALPLPAAK